jgi:ferredoxin-NADP reductase
MLTEPLTMPPSRIGRFLYGALVGLLFAPAIHLGSFYFTPEIGLLVGNLFVYFISPEGRFALKLTGIKELASDTTEFIFTPDFRFHFLPGQYLEWTLGHNPSDNRGNRRYFTIASSPTENDVRLGVKFYEPASSFKRALGTLKIGDTVSVSHLAGDFVLPKNRKKKLAFIAGGIGITPFRSQAKYLMDTNDCRAVTLLYLNKSDSEIAYKELFDEARQKIGMKTFYHSGRISSEIIAEEIPDYSERLFYISGPNSMVETYKHMLLAMGVPRRHIKTDYFPGFA